MSRITCDAVEQYLLAPKPPTYLFSCFCKPMKLLALRAFAAQRLTQLRNSHIDDIVVFPSAKNPNSLGIVGPRIGDIVIAAKHSPALFIADERREIWAGWEIGTGAVGRRLLDQFEAE